MMKKKGISSVFIGLFMLLLISIGMAGLLYDYNPVTEVEKTFILNEGDGVSITGYKKATVVIDNILEDEEAVDLRIYSPEGSVAQDITLDGTKYSKIDINRDKKMDFIIVFNGLEGGKAILGFARDELSYKGGGEVVGGASVSEVIGGDVEGEAEMDDITGKAIVEVKPRGDLERIANKGKGILITFLVVLGIIGLVHFYRKTR